MTLDDLKKLKDAGTTPFRIKSKSSYKGVLNINHKIAIPVDDISSIYEADLDISVLDPDGKEVGVLCFTRRLGSINWTSLTENQFIAFLNEANYSTRNEDFVFEYNYLIIDDYYYDDYVELHKVNSALWGGFIHPSSDSMNSYSKAFPNIQITKLSFSKNIFTENAKRAVLQPFAHERYLKLYHLLELRFDVDIVEELQSLDLDLNPDKIGKIFNDYSRNTEFPRLKRIIQSKCTDIESLVQKINAVKNYQSLAKDIFYKFGKDSNPFKDESKFETVCPFGFDDKTLRQYDVSYKEHSIFITHLAAYWIYRVRCCIAHNKLGEYILSHNEEEFVAEFAEPLLKEAVSQCFIA